MTDRLVDAWVEAGVSDGFTFPADNPRAGIDDVVARTSRWSCDHLPVVAGLELPGDGIGISAGQLTAR